MKGQATLPLQGRPERQHLYEWVAVEEEYVAAKFDAERGKHDEYLRTYDFDFWERQIIQYLDRARLFLYEAGEAPLGQRRALELRAQQALAKGMMTLKGCVEATIRVYGPLPAPGEPSGEVKL